MRRLLRATVFSLQGFAYAWKNEAAFRQELVLTIVLVPAALWLGRSATERALLVGVCLIVLIVELLNAAVEATIDRLGDEQHELSGAAKDMGSAAVLVSLTLLVLTWAAVVYDRFVA